MSEKFLITAVLCSE